MDTNIQLQALKSQIENMKIQIDNIELQNNNMLMMNNPIGEQLLNISIQMFNAAIQAFKTGKNMTMAIMDKYFDQLRKISEHINSIVNDNNLQKMQQQMMMQQQTQQQMIIQQQMMQQQEEIQKSKMKNHYKNVIFVSSRGTKINIVAKFGTKVEEVLNQYMIRIYGKIIDNLFLSIMLKR